MRRILSLFLTLVLAVGIFSVVPVSAETTLNDLTKHTLTNKSYKESLNLTSDSIVTTFCSPFYELDGEGWSGYVRIHDSLNVKIFEEYVSSSSTVNEFKFYLPKGTYTVNFDTSSSYSSFVYTKITFEETSLYGKNNKVQNGKLIDYTYFDDENVSYLTLTKDSSVNIWFTLPVRSSDGHVNSLDFSIKNSDGAVLVDDYYYKDNQTGNYTFSETFLLRKGSYQIVFKTYSGDYNADFVTNQYKITTQSASKYIVKKPTLKSSVQKSGYSYKLTFNWADDESYDVVEVWSKTNNGKWKIATTLKNSKYYRYNGAYIWYYSGDISYYKIRAYKQGIGCKKYSAYSNVISMKKLDKPTVKVSAKKKAFSVTYTKVTGATGFQVRYKLNSSKKWTTKTFKTSSSVTKTISKLKSKKKYNIQARSYKKVGSDTMYSSWSSKKTIKVK